MGVSNQTVCREVTRRKFTVYRSQSWIYFSFFEDAESCIHCLGLLRQTSWFLAFNRFALLWFGLLEIIKHAMRIYKVVLLVWSHRSGLSQGSMRADIARIRLVYKRTSRLQFWQRQKMVFTLGNNLVQHFRLIVQLFIWTLLKYDLCLCKERIALHLYRLTQFFLRVDWQILHKSPIFMELGNKLARWINWGVIVLLADYVALFATWERILVVGWQREVSVVFLLQLLQAIHPILYVVLFILGARFLGLNASSVCWLNFGDLYPKVAFLRFLALVLLYRAARCQDIIIVVESNFIFVFNYWVLLSKAELVWLRVGLILN